MKKLLCVFILVFIVGYSYSQKVKDTPSAIATISSDDIERPPSGSFSEILRSIQPTASVGPSWATGKYSDSYMSWNFAPRPEVVIGGYRDFIFSDEFNKKIKTRAGLRLRFGGTFEKWTYGQYDEGKDKINWGYIEAPAEIAYKFDLFGKKAFAGVGLSPGIKLYANVKYEDGSKDKLENISSINLFVSPIVGWQVSEHSEFDISYDFGVEQWGSDSYPKHHINSVRFAYVHKFY